MEYWKAEVLKVMQWVGIMGSDASFAELIDPEDTHDDGGTHDSLQVVL